VARHINLSPALAVLMEHIFYTATNLAKACGAGISMQ
jgi:hypothetical protein